MKRSHMGCRKEYRAEGADQVENKREAKKSLAAFRGGETDTL